MIRNSRNWSVKQVLSMINKGTILFDNPLQRPSGQWKVEDKSLLIDSLLRYFIPIVISLQTKINIGNETLVGHDMLDGKQRLTIINEFFNDEFALTQCKPIKLSTTGERFDISGKKYSELPEAIQEELKGATVFFWSVELEDEDDEEEVAEDIFKRTNNGKPVSKEHIAFISSSKNIKEFVRRTITENPLFMNVAHYANGAVKKSDREMTILQSIVLVSGLDYNSFAAKDIEKFFIENTITEDILDKVEGYFVDIAEAFKHEHNKFANKLNISAMVSLLNNNEDTEKVQEFIQYYSKAVKAGDNYRRHCGAGSTKKETVKNRIKALQDMFDAFVKSSKVTPTSTPNTSLKVVSIVKKTIPENVSILDDEESDVHVDFIPSNVMAAYNEGNW